jgi:hypothetical protein
MGEKVLIIKRGRGRPRLNVAIQDRYCEHCGALIKKTPSMCVPKHNLRRFCGKSCAKKHQDQAAWRELGQAALKQKRARDREARETSEMRARAARGEALFYLVKNLIERKSGEGGITMCKIAQMLDIGNYQVENILLTLTHRDPRLCEDDKGRIFFSS